MDNLEPLTTDGGRIVKMEVDYSATCDEKIVIAESLAASGKLQEALDTLLMLEKQTRTVSCLFYFHITTTNYGVYIVISIYTYICILYGFVIM